jgi:hypothetical protein
MGERLIPANWHVLRHTMQVKSIPPRSCSRSDSYSLTLPVCSAVFLPSAWVHAATHLGISGCMKEAAEEWVAVVLEDDVTVLPCEDSRLHLHHARWLKVSSLTHSLSLSLSLCVTSTGAFDEDETGSS